MIRVSVIIPTYGPESDPCRAIDSVFSQDYSDMEVIVVDDNGLGTQQQRENEKKLHKYSNNKNFKYIIHEVNKNGSAARNTGVRNATGDYVCFLDDDDYFSESDKIAKQIECSEKLDDSWCGTYSSSYIYENERLLKDNRATLSGNICFEYMSQKILISTGAPVIRKSAFMEIGGFDESFRRHQDWEFFSRLLDRYKIQAVPNAYYKREYKKNYVKKSARDRVLLMNHYTESMKSRIHSIPKRKLDKILKHLYAPIFFSAAKEKNTKVAIEILREQKYGFADYVYLIVFFFNYLARRNS